MKKFLMIAAACVALASCVKNEVGPVVVDNSPIGFQAVQGLESTRATTDYPTSETFIASAYLVEATEDGNVADWDAIGDEENLKIAYFENKEVAYDAISSKWTTNPAYYWPQQGQLTFYAYANSHIDGVVRADTKDLVFVDYDVDANDKDLLVADIEKDRTPGLVPVVFRHKLTNVQFKIDTESDTDPRTITLKAIELRAMQHKGNYTMPSDYPINKDGWQVGVDLSTYNLFSGTMSVVASADPAVSVATTQEYFMPQELGDNKVLYVEYDIVYNGSKETVKVAKKLNTLDDGGNNDNTWKMNEQVVFTLVVGAPEPIIWKQPVIDGWTVEEIAVPI